MFVFGKPFQPGEMVASKVRAPRSEHLSGALWGKNLPVLV
jgi:hypothetical protein